MFRSRFIKSLLITCSFLILLPAATIPPIVNRLAPGRAPVVDTIRLVNQRATDITQLLHDTTGVFAAADPKSNILILKGPSAGIIDARKLAEELERDNESDLDP